MKGTLKKTLILLFIAVPAVLPSTVIHVPGDQPTIQAGIDAASSGDTVLVADGTYTGPGNRDLNLGGKALTVRSAGGADFCVINCQGRSSDPHRGFRFDSGEGKASVVQGFTIRNGWSTCGGAIYCNGASPVIRNNTITGNTADHHGGGVYCEKTSLTLTRNTISGNTSGLNGGGVYCYEVSEPAITRNIISGNNAEFSGGGISCFWSSSPTIEHNTIEQNLAGEYGGGLDCFQSSPTVHNNTVIDNISDFAGGGIYCCSCSAPKISDTTLAGNAPNAIFTDSTTQPVHAYDTQIEYLKASGPVMQQMLCLNHEPRIYGF